MSFSRLFKKNYKQVGGSIFLGVLEKYLATYYPRNEDKKQTRPPIQSSYKFLIEEIFRKSGVDVDRYGLDVAAFPQSKHFIASVSQCPIGGHYQVNVSIDEIEKLSKKSNNTLSKEDILKALSAHEAVHAKEQHELIIAIGSTYCALWTLQQTQHLRCCQSTRLSLAIAAFATTYHYLSKQMEYRADRLAVECIPSTKATLKEILCLLHEQSTEHSTLLSAHPTPLSRVARLS